MIKTNLQLLFKKDVFFFESIRKGIKSNSRLKLLIKKSKVIKSKTKVEKKSI